jgi:hypothetical protein
MNTKKHLKDLFFLLVAGALVGFACFAIMYWVFRLDYKESMATAWTVGIIGVVTDYIKPYFSKKRQQN